MNSHATPHERFMNGSRIILPRVGVGGGVGGGDVGNACMASTGRREDDRATTHALAPLAGVIA